MAAGWLELTFYSEAVAVLSLSVWILNLDDRLETDNFSHENFRQA